MATSGNCPNCGAPYDMSLCKCPYCGTAYLDLSYLDLDQQYLYLKIKQNGQYMLQKVVLEDLTIDINHESGSRVYNYGEPIRIECSPTMETTLKFRVIPENGTYYTILTSCGNDE